MNQYLVRFYKTRSGGTHAQEFLMQLDKKLRANMMSMITLLQEKRPGSAHALQPASVRRHLRAAR